MRGLRTAVLALVTVSSAAQDIDLNRQAALGRHLAGQFRRTATLIVNAEVQQYMEGIGQRLAAHIPDANFPFTFGVITDDPCRTSHEPVSFPGGYVFVPAALFIAAQDEAEFAGMLAHAMEHIVQPFAGSRKLASYGSIPLIFAGGWTTGCFNGQAIPAAFQTQQRSLARGADNRAIQVAADSGFDPQALVRYIRRLQVPDAFGENRIAAIESAIGKLSRAGYTQVSSSAFVTAKEQIRRLTEQPLAHPRTPPSLNGQPPQ